MTHSFPTRRSSDRVAEAGEFLLPERAVADGPGVALAIVPDQARQSGVLAGQAGEVLGFDRRDEAGECVADQQRLLLPVIAQEVGRGHAQRLLRGAVDLDGWLCLLPLRAPVDVIAS